MSRTFTLKIAGIKMAFTCDNAKLYNALCRRYRVFLTRGNSIIHIILTWKNSSNSVKFSIPDVSFQDTQVYITGIGFSGSCDFATRQGLLEIELATPVEAIDYFMRVMFAVIIFQSGGIMLHGAGILHKGCGYLFFGHSGSGKTTVSRASINDEVLNDDLVAVLPEEKTWIMHSTPFSNPTQVEPKPISTPLVTMYRLIQDRAVFLDSLTPGQALAELISNIPVITTNATESERLIARCVDLLKTVPVYKLHFLPDDTFWKVIDN